MLKDLEEMHKKCSWCQKLIYIPIKNGDGIIRAFLQEKALITPTKSICSDCMEGGEDGNPDPRRD